MFKKLKDKYIVIYVLNTIYVINTNYQESYIAGQWGYMFLIPALWKRQVDLSSRTARDTEKSYLKKKKTQNKKQKKKIMQLWFCCCCFIILSFGSSVNLYIFCLQNLLCFVNLSKIPAGTLIR